MLRFLRLLRVVRLLRLLDNRDPDSTLFGLVKSNSMGIQLAGIGFEFVCIFIITAGIIYDLEYTTNPNVNDLNDTLYWAILTLTGIGQPFEVVTAGGRVATVMAIGVALIVVPGQLAKLATVAGAQDIIEGFMPDESYESYDEDDFESFDEGDGWTALPAVNASMSNAGRRHCHRRRHSWRRSRRHSWRRQPRRRTTRLCRARLRLWLCRAPARVNRSGPKILPRLRSPSRRVRRRVRSPERRRHAPEDVGRPRVRHVRAADPRAGRAFLSQVRRKVGHRGVGGDALREALGAAGGDCR